MTTPPVSSASRNGFASAARCDAAFSGSRRRDAMAWLDSPGRWNPWATIPTRAQTCSIPSVRSSTRHSDLHGCVGSTHGTNA